MKAHSLRLLGHVISLEARSAMSYRVDFWINAVVSFFAQLGVVWFLWSSIYRETGQASIGGRDMQSMMLYYILVILIGKVVRGQEQMHGISSDIYEGGLSRYLLYPTSYFRYKYAQHLGALSPALMQLILMGSLTPLLVDMAESGITLARIPAALSAMMLGNMLYFMLLVPLQSVAFWADNVWSLAVLMRFASALLGGSMLPVDLFPNWARGILDWLPFRYLFDFPVNTLTGHVSQAEWLKGMGMSAGWILVLILVSHLVWKRGEKQYTGVGI